MDILIFKTSVNDKEEVNIVRNLFQSVAKVVEFNIDLEDCDKVLRIVTSGLSPQRAESLVHSLGFDCSELKD